MSSKPKPPPRDADEPPGLYSDIAERPEVKALLAELRKGLKPGEDPLFYALPEVDEPPDPDAKGPDAARVYVPPTPLAPPIVHKTLDMDKVRVAPHANPRTAVTLRIERPSVAADAVAAVKAEPAAESRRGAPPRWAVMAAGSMIGAGVVAMALVLAVRGGGGGTSSRVEPSSVAAGAMSAEAAPTLSAEATSCPTAMAASCPTATAAVTATATAAVPATAAATVTAAATATATPHSSATARPEGKMSAPKESVKAPPAPLKTAAPVATAAPSAAPAAPAAPPAPTAAPTTTDDEIFHLPKHKRSDGTGS